MLTLINGNGYAEDGDNRGTDSKNGFYRQPLSTVTQGLDIV